MDAKAISNSNATCITALPTSAVGAVGEFCANCSVFGWPQPKDLATLKRCSKCRVLWYCGELCQKEHWERVHRDHCRYLAKPEIAKASLHIRGCPRCKEAVFVMNMERMGLGREADSPTYPCIDRGVESFPPGFSSPHPFPLVGLIGDRPEMTVMLLLKIINKMVAIQHPVYMRHQEKIKEIMSQVYRYREEVWGRRKIFPEGHSGRINIKIRFRVLEMEINSDPRGLEIGDKFNLWKLFGIMVIGLQNLGLLDQLQRMKSPLTSVKGDYHFLLQKAGVSNYLEVFNRVLDLIRDRLVPYTELVRVVCDDLLERKCHFCSRPVTVADVTFGESIVNNTAQIAVTPSNVGQVSCNTGTCMGKMARKLGVENNLLSSAVSGSTNLHACDNCYQMVPIQAIHRCSTCMKKQYCSKVCFNQDIAKGHSPDKFCRNVGEERKLRGSRKERGENAKDAARQVLKEGKMLAKEMGVTHVTKMCKEFKKGI